MLQHNVHMKITECPRDAMQGWPHLLNTQDKITYINSLLRVGFDVIDFGSFVSAKAIPQMADTKEVLAGLDLGNTQSQLLAIVANVRGAEEAVAYEAIQYLGFPFSISPTFQLRNTNSTIEESRARVQQIQELCVRHNKTLVVYLSMGFGNPYGDVYNEEILLQWAAEMAGIGVTIVSLADTVGVATPHQVFHALQTVIPQYPQVSFGAHLHCTPYSWRDKLDAAVRAGCQRIDGALKGIGGCPMAQDDLVGNMATENIIAYLQQQQLPLQLNAGALAESLQLASRLFVHPLSSTTHL
ncbi:hydroxymethylglutaryl-CoA lyase [Filimonas zeae]|uniref:Hydroxymethylglutaryl-CoA lyase n=2 Tax=Filimonas zeae TaxID=1737353 RepID=A0A917J0Z8_9BACT|nr:hydroxymethylglutaryl-CoA lyase [Filimonas zeae]